MEKSVLYFAEPPQPRFAYTAVEIPIGTYAASRRGTATTIDIHTNVVLVGYAGCLFSFIFCIAIVVLPPGPTLPNGALRYISEGLDSYCGWTVVFMGTFSMMILVVQLVASTFMRNRWAALASVIQAASWNAVAGVNSTGWSAHHVALAVFLLSLFAFNWIASNDPAYGSRVYRAANLSCLVLALGFNALALAAESIGQRTREGIIVRCFAVAVEFVLMFSVVFQNLCLVRALDAYHLIHLRFEHR